MSGHGSNVLSLELSQYGLLSGSMDTKVKVMGSGTLGSLSFAKPPFQWFSSVYLLDIIRFGT